MRIEQNIYTYIYIYIYYATQIQIQKQSGYHATIRVSSHREDIRWDRVQTELSERL